MAIKTELDKEQTVSQDAYDKAIEAAQKPVYTGTFDQQLSDIYNKINSREKFSYDMGNDAMYQQYKDKYVQQGKMAMKDTMGQAAALTGGYGSSYGQQVGQQSYDAYLQKLGDVVPELYNNAYQQYSDEGDKLQNQYSMLGGLKNDEYSRYRDALSDYNTEQDSAYQKQHQAYSNLYAIIKASGYSPSETELSDAGMSAEQASALRTEYLRQTDQLPVAASAAGGGDWSGGSGGAYNPDVAAQQQKLVNAGYKIAVDGIAGPETEQAAKAYYASFDSNAKENSAYRSTQKK